MSLSIDQFCTSFEASIEKSNKQYYKTSYSGLYGLDSTKIDNCVIDRINVEVVAIHLPKENFEKLIYSCDRDRFEEINLREDHPAVKKAWEQYVAILNLVGYNKRV
jgi:hypothetical protein